MRKLTAIAACSLALALPFVPASAQQPAPADPPSKADPQRFAQTKQRLQERIQQRIDDLQKNKSCVDQAQDEAALRACFPRRQGRGGLPRK